jgi:excisionase family DNA binding protein
MVTETLEMAGARLLGFDAAAIYLNVNLRTIRRLMARGVLQPVHIPTLRRVLFDRQDLDDLIEAGKEERKLTDAAMTPVTTEIGGYVEG